MQQSATAVVAPAAPSLYRHALESIFAFCTLDELAAVSAVSCGWQAAVLNMAPLQCEMSADSDLARVVEMCRAPLRRHVSNVDCGRGNSDPVHASQFLPLLAQHMPHLRELSALLLLTEPLLTFPLQLTSLELSVIPTVTDDTAHLAATLDATVGAAGGLAQLQHFHLRLSWSNWKAGCSLAPLVRAPHLRSLSLAPTMAAVCLLATHKLLRCAPSDIWSRST